jgi:Domain of unknown function (DUF4188)
MAKIFPGRFTAEVKKDFVVFLIGMRVNRWWMFHKWVPTFIAMPRMQRALAKDKSLGMFGRESFFRLFPLTIILVSYWESFEKLDQFAKDRTLPHAEAWSKFMKSVGSNGTVGIYHETYKVSASEFECVYGNMPLFGLASAFNHVPIGKSTDSARQRISKE